MILMSQEDSPKILLLVIVGIIIPLSIIFFGNIGKILTKFGRILTGSANKPVQIEWQRCLGGSNKDEARSVQQTRDGGYIVAGFTKSNDGDINEKKGILIFNDFFIVKLDKGGNIQWRKRLGGSRDDEVYSIQQTRDGGYIVAGVTESNDGYVGENHGKSDSWVIKINENGNIQWRKCFGGSNEDMIYSIQQTRDDGYIMAGITTSIDGDVRGWHIGFAIKKPSEGISLPDFWIVKLDEKGNIEWQKCLGGSDWDWAKSIEQTSDGGYIVAGWTCSNNGNVSGWHKGYSVTGDPLPDFWIVKLDEKGNIEWQKCLGGSDWDEAYSIQQTSDGGYIVAGTTYSNDGDVKGNHGKQDIWMVKLK